MKQKLNFTEGKIALPLVRFAVPVFAALFLQSMYGAVDLFIVGRFATSADVSAVSTGSQIMMTLTCLIGGLSMGITVYMGQMIGKGRRDLAGAIVGGSICLFAAIGAVAALAIAGCSDLLAQVMNAPAEAYAGTVAYTRICGAGFVIIVAFNLIGAVFRGVGDSETPLIAVVFACAFNILGDLLLVQVFGMGAAGAALATVVAQLFSVVLSLLLLRKRELPFTMTLRDIRFRKTISKRVLGIGLPIALQDLLVSISFLVILAIVNSISLAASAGVGVAEKVCGFIMLIPSAFMQSMSAFVAQNIGAGKYSRARKSLLVASLVSAVPAVLMFYLGFFQSSLLAGVFTTDADTVLRAAEYIRAYGIDCLLTCFLFCFIGFYNGLGMTRFVMLQGLTGAFFVRIPVSFLMSRLTPVSLFNIGLATPCSSVVQLIMCLLCLIYANKRFSHPVPGTD